MRNAEPTAKEWDEAYRLAHNWVNDGVPGLQDDQSSIAAYRVRCEKGRNGTADLPRVIAGAMARARYAAVRRWAVVYLTKEHGWPLARAEQTVAAAEAGDTSTDARKDIADMLGAGNGA